jgi:hypothetical protein
MFAASKRKIADQGPAADNEEVFEVSPVSSPRVSEMSVKLT